MSLDEELRTALREETKAWIAPPELKEKILKQVASKQGGRRMKKWLMASVLAATLLIPTGAYAAYHYIADAIYGSQQNVAHIGGTQQQYDRLEEKLQSAKESLSEEEFLELMSLLKEIGSFNLKIADSEGVLHPEQLTIEEQAAYEQLTAELEPFFTRLNEGESPSKADVAASLAASESFWNEQIAIVEKTFSQEQFIDFKSLIKEMRSIEAKVVDPDGSIHSDRLTAKDKADAERISTQLKPYFDKLGIITKPSE